MIGVVIPTRGDRSDFLERCLMMLDRQTLKADETCIISESPKSEDKDITYRYRKGFEKLFAKGCTVVFMIEDDDWYSPEYIETMYTHWINSESPDVFGIGETTYYHLGRNTYSRMIHPNRSSAFSTMVSKAVLDIDFPDDNYPFLDLELWKQLKGKTFIPDENICLGIKHGVGVCGGRGHDDDFKYDNQDKDFHYLKKIVGPSWKYYKNLLI